MRHAEPEELARVVVDPDASMPDVETHLESCASCREELNALRQVVAHASVGPLVPPPPSLRARVLSEALGEAPDEALDDVPPPAPVPLATARSRRKAPWWMVATAAAAALVVGVGIGTLWGNDPEPPVDTDTSTLVASTDLTTVEGTEARGVADVRSSDGVATVHVQAAELGDGDGLREVWLLNVDGTRMVSLGMLPSGDEGDFAIPARLLDEGYRILDISVEPDDGDPTHSGVSIARGELA